MIGLSNKVEYKPRSEIIELYFLVNYFMFCSNFFNVLQLEEFKNVKINNLILTKKNNPIQIGLVLFLFFLMCMSLI